MIMNKAFCLLVIGLLSFSVSNAQEFSFGVKGGPSYVMGGQITGIDNGSGDYSGTVNADSKFKYHIGGFFELRFDKFLIRPEVIYSPMEVEFQFPTQPSTYSVEKVSVPIIIWI